MCTERQFRAIFCRWSCPICGTTKLCGRTDSACQSTTNNLRTHIRATDDAAHGPQGEYPPAVDPSDLDAYVSCE
jgi:hypothetical protein